MAVASSSCAAFVGPVRARAPLVARSIRSRVRWAAARTQVTTPRRCCCSFSRCVLRIEPAFAAPWLPLGVLLGLVIGIAWRAMVTDEGELYFIAAFFAIAAQASWSATWLDGAHLRTAVEIYALFGLVALGVPLLARRSGHPLEPASGGGIVLIASLPLLLFLAGGTVAPEAIWALALLLAILNAGLFIEGAGSALPIVSLVGSHAVVDCARCVVVGRRRQRRRARLADRSDGDDVAHARRLRLGASPRDGPRRAPPGSQPGSAAASISASSDTLFLLLIAINRDWSIPPWPLFGALAVVTLASSVVALATGVAMLHRAAAIAAGVVVTAWISDAGAEWGFVAVVASMTVSTFALAWLVPASRGSQLADAAETAAAVLFVAEGAAIAAATWDQPPFIALLGAHVATLSAILALTWRQRWAYMRQRRRDGRVSRRAKLGAGARWSIDRGINSSRSPRGCTQCLSPTRCSWGDGRGATAIRTWRRSSRARCASSPPARRSRPEARLGNRRGAGRAERGAGASCCGSSCASKRQASATSGAS